MCGRGGSPVDKEEAGRAGGGVWVGLFGGGASKIAVRRAAVRRAWAGPARCWGGVGESIGQPGQARHSWPSRPPLHTVWLSSCTVVVGTVWHWHGTSIIHTDLRLLCLAASHSNYTEPIPSIAISTTAPTSSPRLSSQRRTRGNFPLMGRSFNERANTVKRDTCAQSNPRETRAVAMTCAKPSAIRRNTPSTPMGMA